MASRQAEVTVRKKIAARSDKYYEETRSLGDVAWHAFGYGSRSQVRNLENIANSAARIADILDFVKRQTGRSRPNAQWRYKGFGETLLERLDDALREDAANIFEDVKHEIKNHQILEDDRRNIHIQLCREFIRHLAAHYLFTVGLSTALKGY